jgi:nucleoside recognition membrane protein YjiH
MYDTHRPSSPWLWATFVVCALVGAGLFFVPAFIIRPFRYQGPRALWLAMALHDRASRWTLVAAIVCLVFSFALWRISRRWGKTVLTMMMLLVGFSAVMARMNYFEWMFHPVDSAQFESEAQSKLDPGEMIMAVRFGSDARAYPISQMAYHHVLNDWVGGVPVAVTY